MGDCPRDLLMIERLSAGEGVCLTLMTSLSQRDGSHSCDVTDIDIGEFRVGGRDVDRGGGTDIHKQRPRTEDLHEKVWAQVCEANPGSFNVSLHLPERHIIAGLDAHRRQIYDVADPLS